MLHYPEQRFIARLAVVRRTVSLPENIIGRVEVAEGKAVDLRDVIARGVPPAPLVVVDAAAFFRLRKPEQLEPLMLVEVGEMVEEITPIAGKARERGKRLYAPVRGRIAAVDRGRILIEQIPQVITVEAGVRGRVVEVQPGRGAVIESQGTQIQGVWGNGQRGVAVLRAEPEIGIEAAIRAGELDVKYLGAILYTRRTVTAHTLRNLEESGIAGLIAPSIDYSLRELAQAVSRPVIIIEQFGDAGLSRTVLTILSEMEGQQALIDAYLPVGWEARRPEVFINQPRGNDAPARPNTMLALRTGMSVRVTREPYTGQTGQVVNLPKQPVLLDNGLRVPCAQVQLLSGDTVYIPLANLEVIGK